MADVTDVTDDVEIPSYYVRHNSKEVVSSAFSKKARVNAVTLARSIIAEAENIKAEIVPDGVKMTVTRGL